TVEQLIGEVEAVGYTARRPAPGGTTAGADGEGDEPHDPTRALRDRFLVSAALALPVLVLGMVSSLQFDNWQWLSLTLAAPVVVWGAWPFHVAAWRNL